MIANKSPTRRHHLLTCRVAEQDRGGTQAKEPRNTAISSRNQQLVFCCYCYKHGATKRLLTLVLLFVSYAPCRTLDDLAATSLQQLFPTVGFMDSGEGYPWYGYTVGDDSRIYGDFKRLTGKQKMTGLCRHLFVLFALCTMGIMRTLGVLSAQQLESWEH